MNSLNLDLYRLAGYSNELQAHVMEPEKDDLFKKPDIKLTTGYSCIFNWAFMRYTFVSDSIKQIIGYDKELFLERGFNFLFSIIHPDDTEKLGDIYLAIFNYYYNTAAEQRARLRFSYNFRIRAADNSYTHILRQSNFTSFTNGGKPVLEYINSTDITGFGYGDHTTLAVHRLSAEGTYILCYENEFSGTHSGLSVREKQVLELIRQGCTTKEIAGKLFLSVETIKSHRKKIISKTGAGNMAAAINLMVKKV